MAYKNGQGSSGFEILLEEWGTMGRKRPTVADVLDICKEIEAFAAASYMASEVLGLSESIGPDSRVMDTQVSISKKSLFGVTCNKKAKLVNSVFYTISI